MYGSCKGPSWIRQNGSPALIPVALERYFIATPQQPAGHDFAFVGTELQRLLELDGGEQFHVEASLADHQVVAWSNMDGDPVNGAVQVAPPSDEVGVTGAGMCVPRTS